MKLNKSKLNSKKWIESLKPLDNNVSPQLYNLEPSHRKYTDEGMLRIFHYGNLNSEEERNVLLIGETGCGKTSLINAFINYIAGVNFSDDFRLQLDEVHEVTLNDETLTDEITIYKIYSQKESRLPYTLNIIDAPGISTNKQSSRDNEIINRTRQVTNLLFETIHAACLVINSTIVRLTDEQTYVMAHVSKFLENYSAAKLFVLCTRALSDNPVVIKTLEKLSFNYDGFFCFENGSLFYNQAEDLNKMKRMALYYADNELNLENFFNAIDRRTNPMDPSSNPNLKSPTEQEKKRNPNSNSNDMSGTHSYPREENKSKTNEPETEMRAIKFIKHFDLKPRETFGNWTIYKFPLTNTNDDLLSRKIQVWETQPTDCAEKKSILVWGTCHNLRSKMVEFLANAFLKLQLEEHICWFTIEPTVKKDSEGWLNIYKLHPMNRVQRSYSLTIINIPDEQICHESGKEALNDQFHCLLSQSHLQSVDAAFYVVDNELNKEHLAFFPFDNDFSKFSSVCSFKMSEDNLKKLFPQFKNHFAIAAYEDSSTWNDVKKAFQFAKEILESEECREENFINNLTEIIERGCKISDVKKERKLKQDKIGSLEDQLTEIEVHLRRLEKQMNDIQNISEKNKDYTIKAEIGRKEKNTKSIQNDPEKKEIQPIHAVVNCQECRTTCCENNHNNYMLKRLPFVNLVTHACVLKQQKMCKSCNCPFIYHNISNSVQYKVETQESVKEQVYNKIINELNVEKQNLSKNIRQEKHLCNQLNDELKGLESQH